MNKTRVSPLHGNPAIIVAPIPLASRRPASLWSLVILLVGGSQICPRLAAAGDDDAFRINIRTSVDRVYTVFSKKPAAVHSKLYSLAWIRQAKGGADPLAQPVDEADLLQHLHDVLAAHGFHEPEPGKVPDIVLTVVYGRSRLKNPYEDKSIAIGDDLGMGADSGVVTGDAELMLQERTPGYKSKMAAAGEPKIFISITAWEFPGFFPKAKPKELWRTIINVDDADLDLNAIAGKLLAVGASYFDRELSKEEITIMSNVPEGHVTSGTPTNVPPDSPEK